MENNIFKIVVVSLLICFSPLAKAQEDASSNVIKELQQEVKELKSLVGHQTNTNSSYDPLIPQNFAVEVRNEVFAVINHNENTIELLNPDKNGQLVRFRQILVDQLDGIYKINLVFRPKSVAVYQNHIVYLASNDDSSLVRVLNIKGDKIEEFRFSGAANSFSYNEVYKKLYVAGNNSVGYDVIVIDASKGFEKMTIEGSPSFHYKKPKKADTIAQQDSTGGGLTVIAMTTVFLTLLLIFFVLKLYTSVIIRIQNKRSSDYKENEGEITPIGGLLKNDSDLSGDEYAAIAAALYLYNNELHDEENAILTINKVAKSYSPWSSKLYNMNVYKR